jgi:type IV pilus assembly protein PilW
MTCKTPFHCASKQNRPRLARSQIYMRDSGFTLVELLVALVLGLFLIGGVVSVYISTQQNYKANENLARIQESARFAFDQMGREIRDEGINPCGVKAVSNVVRVSAAVPWWADWNSGTLIGYEAGTVGAGVAFGSSVNDRVSTTDAIMVLRTSMDDADLRVIQSHDVVAKSIVLNTITGYDGKNSDGTSTKYVVLGCDLESGAIFETSATSTSLSQIEYDNSPPSANCTGLLGWPQPADCSGSKTKTFAVSGLVTKLDPAFWYIGPNSNGTRSLWRQRLTRKLGVASGENVEMITDVHDLQVEYLTRDKTLTANALASTWVAANDAKLTAAGGWSKNNNNEVVAVRLTLTFRSPDAVGTDGQPLQRQTVAVIALRNRDVKS